MYDLGHNLWWSWHPEVNNLFRDIDPIRWRQVDHNPIALLREFTPERLAVRASEMVLHSRVNYAYRRLQEYLNANNTWAATNAGVLGARPVAYFSAEFGIHESLPIYSGGLGVLSGDHIKSASGLGIPLIGIGLYYSHGYFKQHLDTTVTSAKSTSKPKSRTCRSSQPWGPMENRSLLASTPAMADCWPAYN